jgi:hypothetical protein
VKKIIKFIENYQLDCEEDEFLLVLQCICHINNFKENETVKTQVDTQDPPSASAMESPEMPKRQ